jgi:uncharacterized protein
MSTHNDLMMTIKSLFKQPIIGILCCIFFDIRASRRYYAPLMSEQLPRNIEPFRFAEKGRRLEGRLPLTNMARLAPSIEASTGEVRFELEFGVDLIGSRYMKGHLHADLQMRCQRCMDNMTVTIDTELSNGLVKNKQEADNLSMDYEPMMVDGDEPVLLADIIEDELILGLPIVAMHGEDTDCSTKFAGNPVVEEEIVKKPNPFAALVDLKKSKQASGD